MRSLLTRFRKAHEGSIAVMSALSGACVIGCLALAVDVGSLHLERRQLQNVADLAAVAAVSNMLDPAGAASSVLAANKVNASMQVEAGTFTADPNIHHSARYSPGGATPNAVRVTLTKPGTLYFAGVVYGGGRPQITVRATASEQNVAQFSIGSRLASLKEGILNDLLGDLLGTTISLNLMDYNGLVAADLDLVDFMKALATEANVTVGTYDEVLASELTLGDVLGAAAIVAGNSGANAAQIAINKIALAPGSISALTLDGGELLDLGSIGGLALGERPSGLAAKVSALDLVRAAANAAGPNNQAQIALGAGLTGVASVTVSVVIGEPEQGTSWITAGPAGVEVYTAQTRVRADVTLVQRSILTSLVSLKLPIAIDIAAGKARLTDISCGANPKTDAEVTLTVRPAIGGIYIGQPKNSEDWNSFKSPSMEAGHVANVALGLISVSAQAWALASSAQDVTVKFAAGEIDGRIVKTVNASAPLSTLITSAFSSLDVTAKLLGLSVFTTAGAVSAVKPLLQPLGAVLDPVLNDLLDALGIGLGEADVRVHGVRCGAPALVM